MRKGHLKIAVAASLLTSLAALSLIGASDEPNQNERRVVRLEAPRLVVANQQTVTFDDAPVRNAVLNGQYPAGLIDWGSGVWFANNAVGKFKTRNLKLNGTSRRTGTFAFLAPRRVVSLDVLNRGSSSTTVSLACPGQATASMVINPSVITTLRTNWTANCSPVTVSVGNGNTLFDNLVIDDTSARSRRRSRPTMPTAWCKVVLTVPVGTGVLANDTAGTGGTLSAVGVSATSQGTLALASDGSFVYTPLAGFTGSDAFTYLAHNTAGDSNVGTVTVTVTPPASYWIPPANTSWDWQLNTPVDQSTDVTMYDIEMFNNDASVIASLHAKGRKVICYTDVGSWENGGRMPRVSLSR